MNCKNMANNWAKRVNLMQNREKIIKAAAGKIPADLVLKNGKIFCGFTGEFIIGDIAIVDGIIVGIGKYIGKETIDVTGKFLTPGFIDAHIHIESSMLSPLEFARTVVPLGTTAVIADPHEIANVAGIDGIDYMLKATEDLPISAYFMLPSCVPATTMEASGAILEAADFRELIKHPRVLGLGEMMNFPGVIAGDEKVLQKLELARGKCIDGHAPGIADKDLMAYAAAGVRSDHECVTQEEALARLRAGMYVMIREGSAAKNLRNLLPIINSNTAQFCMFAADDRHPADLLDLGHINYMVRVAVASGVPVTQALQMATINAARYFGIQDIGVLAPNYQADINVFDNLTDFVPSLVLQSGKVVAQDGKATFAGRSVEDEKVEKGICIRSINKEQLRISAKGTLANVIGLVPEQITTCAMLIHLPVKNGEAFADPKRDLLKLAVFERHHATGNVAVAMVDGFGLQTGAIASTIAHDSHNLIVIGTNDDDMILAAKTIEKIGGGLAIIDDGKVIGTLAMPIAGLMSKEPVKVVEEKLHQLKNKAHEMGVKACYDPFLTLAFLSLPVIPELKLTDQGLVDVNRFSFVPVMVDK